MSRSRKTNPISGFTLSDSEKEDKREYNRNLRHKNKIKLKNIDDPEELILSEIEDVSDPWNMAKDGKYWFGNLKELLFKVLRK